jgi:ureidoacrylate peracid hydrolase
MHQSELPRGIAERAAVMFANAGRMVLDPARVAHVVIDLQNGFMAPGALLEVPVARSIVPTVNRISQAVRQSGGLNVFVRFTIDPEERHYWGPMFDRVTPDYRRQLAEAFRDGGVQHALWPDLDVQNGDLIVDKTRFSAFIPGTCSLDDLLSARNIDTLIITGTLSNVCCESTTRDAMQMGYRVLFIQDGNATLDDTTHNATLANLAMIFAEVVESNAVLARLAGG